MGRMQVPAGALYGAQTARAAENFFVSGWRMPQAFIVAVARIKQAAAGAHKKTGRLDAKLADAIIAAAGEVIDGKLDEHFVLEAFGTGSGTSTNMNANEVIANRAAGLLGGQAGDKSLVHPNDHVNMGQSSNDVIPSAMHISAAVQIDEQLLPALEGLRDSLGDKAGQFDDVVKVARTHLMDAVPIRLGQEFSGYAAQIDAAMDMLRRAREGLYELAMGGTAVGTGLNAPEGFGAEVCRIVAEATGLPFREAANHFQALACRNVALSVSGALRVVAIAMGKIASDIRLLGGGPRCGLGELLLPPVQPGSSMMPGKVNPVICESVIQVACQVVGCDAAITAGATGGVGGILELNLAMPMIAANLLLQIKLLAGAAAMFAAKCVVGLRADEARCRELVTQSLAMVTALAPEIGYDAAAEVAAEAYDCGKTIRQVCLEKNILPADRLDALLDPRKQTGGN